MKKESTVFAKERRIKILEFVRENNKSSVSELAEWLNVSPATIRNDLRELDRFNLLIRTHGGAIGKTKMGFELDSHHKEARHLDEKKAIARKAIDLIEDGDRILLDTGTTTLELAKLMHYRNNITVVTNDIEIARLLEDMESAETVLMGGVLRKGHHCTLGEAGRKMLYTLTADKAFLGANSLSLAKGATTPDIHHAETKKAMLASANQVVLLCDSSKLGNVSFAKFASVEDIAILVTDAIGETEKREFESRGLEVLIAG